MLLRNSTKSLSRYSAGGFGLLCPGLEKGFQEAGPFRISFEDDLYRLQPLARVPKLLYLNK